MAISRKTVYTLFVFKFLFSVSLIFWTVKLTLSADVGKDDDNSFLSEYKNVNSNFNKIYQENIDFNSKYNVEILINNGKIDDISYKDVYLSQRNIKNRDERKNILNYKENTISIIVKDKNNKLMNNIDANIIFTRPSTHKDDVKLNIVSINEKTNFNIAAKSYWNIMGTIKVDNNRGHFYIKTNSK